MDFIVEIPTAGQTLTATRASEERSCPQRGQGRNKRQLDDVECAGSHLVSSPLFKHHKTKKQTCSIEDAGKTLDELPGAIFQAAGRHKKAAQSKTKATLG